jgi:hypothetical protein
VKVGDRLYARGRKRPLLHGRRLAARDARALAGQTSGRRFDASIVSDVAVRCSHGFPAVVTCAPLRGDRPFPTTFWLTCPWLNRLCGALESSGGVESLRIAAAGNRGSWADYNLLAARIRIMSLPPAHRRFLSRHRPAMWGSLARGGVGGIRSSCGGGVKCMHLQVAYWLALGGHPADSLLERAVRPLECRSPSEWGCEPAIPCSYAVRKEI